jgi:hypothetical protein
MAERGQTVEGVFHLVSQDQAANQVAIGNSIGSLRLLGATDWRKFVEELSVVERALRSEPTGVYPRMDFATRDRYRLAVESVAKRSALSEEEVARAAIALAAMPEPSGSGHAAHVGYYLVGDGRAKLERRVDMQRGVRLTVRHLARRFRVALYGGAIALATAALAGALSFGASRLGFSGWSLAGLTLVCVIAASQLAINVVHWAVTRLVSPRTMPRLDFSAGIPPEHQSVVAVPTLLTDTAEVDHLIESLEVRFLANRDAQLAFALLSDFDSLLLLTCYFQLGSDLTRHLLAIKL